MATESSIGDCRSKTWNFEGAGIYYAATEVEARTCRNWAVVIGQPRQAAMYCEIFAHVHLGAGPSLAASMSDYLSSRSNNPRITIHYNSQMTCLHGDNTLQATISRDQTVQAQPTGIFVMVGAAPNTAWLSGLVGSTTAALSKLAMMSVHSPCHLPPGILLWAMSGGICKRVASVGEGSVVISEVWDHVRSDDD